MGVQINGDTGNISATKADYSGNVTIGGTLTYEDVTNIDSVGLITAREGIEVGARPGVAASISVDGNMIVSGISTFGGDVQVPDKIIHSGDTNTAIRFPAADTITAETGGSERLRIASNGHVAIGTDSPNSALPLTIAGQYPGIQFKDNQGTTDFNINADSAAFRIQSGTAGAGPSEKFRIGSSGQIGLGGANYGSAGQVLTSQGSGSVVQWATPAVTGGNMFIAKMNSGYNTSNNTDGEIVFQNEVYDPDSRYNNSNGRFTPNVAGYYFIDASLQFSTNSANNNFESTIWKNGTEQFVNRMRNPASNTDLHCKVSGIVSVNGSSDYISIAAWQNSGGNLTVNPGNGSYFMGFFLRSL